MQRRPCSIQATWLGVTGGPLIGMSTAQMLARMVASSAHAQCDSRARQPTADSGSGGGGPNAASTIRFSSSLLEPTYRYRAIVPAPSSAATRAIETAASPSVAPTWTAAATIFSRLSPGLGPLPGRSRSPQTAARLAGSPSAAPPPAAAGPSAAPPPAVGPAVAGPSAAVGPAAAAPPAAGPPA